MLSNPIKISLQNQFESCMVMLQKLIHNIPQNIWSSSIDDTLVYHQVYHVLFFIDNWFRDTYIRGQKDHFVEIFGVTPDYNTPLEQNIFLSQDDMQSYLKKIYTKTMRVFSNLTDENLGKPIINGGSMEYTHMDVIIGQIRHIMYHVGYLNSFLKRENSPVSNWYAHNEGEKLKFEK